MIDLEKLERLHAEATPGPWFTEYTNLGGGVYGQIIFDSKGERIALLAWHKKLKEPGVVGTDREENARYIVAACNSLPDLITENRALQERVQTLEREIGDCNSEVSYWREEYEGEVQFAEDRIRELERQKKLLAAKVVEISNVKFCKDCKFRGPCYLNNAKVTEDTNVCVEAVIYWTEQTSKEVKSE